MLIWIIGFDQVYSYYLRRLISKVKAYGVGFYPLVYDSHTRALADAQRWPYPMRPHIVITPEHINTTKAGYLMREIPKKHNTRYIVIDRAFERLRDEAWGVKPIWFAHPNDIVKTLAEAFAWDLKGNYQSYIETGHRFKKTQGTKLFMTLDDMPNRFNEALNFQPRYIKPYIPIKDLSLKPTNPWDQPKPLNTHRRKRKRDPVTFELLDPNQQDPYKNRQGRIRKPYRPRKPKAQPINLIQ